MDLSSFRAEVEAIRDTAVALVERANELLAVAQNLPEYGTPLGIADANGVEIKAGDRLHFTGSDRYGEGDGVAVRGLPNSDKARVEMTLPDGTNYRPGAYRVTIVSSEATTNTEVSATE